MKSNFTKSIILLVLSMIVTSSSFASSFNMSSSVSNEKERLCGVFQEKVSTYGQTMRDDEYAKQTLKSYENRAKLYCSK